MSADYLAALLVERDGLRSVGKTARLAAVEAELARLGYRDAVSAPVIETADAPPAEAAVIKRGPGRPRKE